MTCAFIDGPAAGRTLDLRRAPHFLRVVTAEDGTVDALDQPTDEPAAGETIHVYVAEAGSFSTVYVCVRGRNAGAGGRYESARYRHLAGLENTVGFADRDAWVGWLKAHGNAAAITAGLDPWQGTGA